MKALQSKLIYFLPLPATPANNSYLLLLQRNLNATLSSNLYLQLLPAICTCNSYQQFIYETITCNSYLQHLPMALICYRNLQNVTSFITFPWLYSICGTDCTVYVVDCIGYVVQIAKVMLNIAQAMLTWIKATLKSFRLSLGWP